MKSNISIYLRLHKNTRYHHIIARMITLFTIITVEPRLSVSFETRALTDTEKTAKRETNFFIHTHTLFFK